MPERPPKKWMRNCIKGVEKGSDVRDPGAVCGSLWYHKMSESDRRTATRKEERRKSRK